MVGRVLLLCLAFRWPVFRPLALRWAYRAGPSGDALVNASLDRLASVVAVLRDPTQQEALIVTFEREWETPLGLAPGTFRRRLG